MSLVRGSSAAGSAATEESFNKIFPDKLDSFRFSFNYQAATGEVALVENMPDGSTQNINEFGSIITDRFVSTNILGGLQYQHADGYKYYHVRASTGNSKSAVFNNYDSQAIIANNSDVIMVKNTEVKHERADTGGTEEKNLLTWSTEVQAVNHELVNFIRFTSTANGTYIARHWWVNSDGETVGQTINKQAWESVPNGTVSADNLQFLKNHDAVEVVFDGNGVYDLPVSAPLAIESGDTFTHHLEFKEVLPVDVHVGTSTPFVVVGFTEIEVNTVAAIKDVEEVNDSVSGLEWLIYNDLHTENSIHTRKLSLILTRNDETIIWDLT